MKYLLTSGGVRNPSLVAALVELLGKPIAEASALCIPTASYGHPHVTPEIALSFLTGETPPTMTELGWKSLGLLELTSLPSIEKERWVEWVEKTDAFLVNGGDALYLSYWMKQSGLADMLPSLKDKVWVGMSAGSMIMTPRIGEEFVQWTPPNGGDDSTLGIVDFSFFPHLDHEMLPWNTMANAEKWSAKLSNPTYAIDDETAFKVVDGNVEIISEGHWKQLRS